MSKIANNKSFIKYYPLLLFFAAFFLGGSLFAGDYFVSTEGSNANPGTINSPWRTIQYAANSATPGSNVYVRGGTYNEKVVMNVQGNVDQYITFQPYGSETVIISAKGLPNKSDGSLNSVLLVKNKKYLKWSGFEMRDIKATEASGIRVEGYGSFLEFRNNTIHEIRGGGSNGGAMGITVYGTNDSNAITNIIIDGNHIFDCDPAHSEALTLNGNVRNFEVTNNIVHDVNNIGIDFIGGEDWIGSKVARQGICKGNIVYRARSSYGGGYAGGIYVDGGVNIVIEDNEVYECDMGIEIGCENSGFITRNIKVKNNYIHNNDKVGIVFGGYSKSAGRVKSSQFTGNTLYKNDSLREGTGEIWIQYANDNIIEYNSIVTNSQNVVVYSERGNNNNTMDYNHYCIEDGIQNAIFVWKNREYEGLRAFQNATGQEANATTCQ